MAAPSFKYGSTSRQPPSHAILQRFQPICLSAPLRPKLPPKTISVVSVELSAEERDYYVHLETGMAAQFKKCALQLLPAAFHYSTKPAPHWYMCH